MSRIVLGFAAAMVTPGLLLAAVTLNPGSALVGLTFSVPATLLIGLPLFLFLRRRSKLQWWRCGFVGGIAGLACALPFIFLGPTAVYISALVSVSLGALSGLAFWVVALNGMSSNHGVQPTPVSGAADAER